MVKVNVYNKTGAKAGEVDLPAAFEADHRPDLIRKAVNTFRANRRQPYGSDPMAGKKQAERSIRSGRGISRVPRATQGSNAVFAPHAVGGRRAHPPKVEKIWAEKINKKENALALRSALAATADAELVSARGHKFNDALTLPVVLEDGIESLDKTKDVRDLLEKVGVGDDLVRADEGAHQRPGIGKLRGRRRKVPKSILFVVSDEDSAVARAARNLVGVDVTTPGQLNVERVAPGGDAGRLTVFTKKALEALNGGEA